MHNSNDSNLARLPAQSASAAAVSVLEQAIADGRIAGGSVAVWAQGHNQVRAFRGFADRETGLPITDTSLYRLASMTKPIVAVAIMQLVESGELDLNDPVSRFIPEYARTTVREISNTTGLQHLNPDDHETTRPVVEAALESASIVAARRGITVRDLLTHSSGLGQGIGSYYDNYDISAQRLTLAEKVSQLASVPGDFQPGAEASYSGMVGFDILGRLVEIVSGLDLETYFQQKIFRPLGMADTTFLPTKDQEARLVTVYETPAGEGGGLEPADISIMMNQITAGTSDRCFGSGGLVGSMADYERFARMLANNGELDGTRVLAADSIRRMSQERGEGGSVVFEPDMRWGLGVIVADQVTDRRSAGTWGWSGSYGTHFFVNPTRNQAVVLMINQANIGGAGSPVSLALERALVGALD